MLHLDTITPYTLSLLKQIQALPEFSGTRLVGGTALALQLGHRISVDLDLFGEWPMDVDLHSVLNGIGKVRKSSGTPDGRLQFFYVDGIKVDCVSYSEYPWLDDPVEESGVRLASVRDIAAMKVNAITNRGTRKDFVDLSFLLDHYAVDEVFRWYGLKYQDANLALALRSMSYFADAETMPMPRMLVSFDWEKAKKRICEEIRKLVLG